MNTELQTGPRLLELRDNDRGAIALVGGKVVTELPTDLYIPPDALEVFLETFEGPLDLLLYLIRRQNLDILEIKVAAITAQYMSYIELMNALQLELAGEYLLMAAMLAEIKSRMLLPRPAGVEDDEDDPRAELIRRLQEHEQIRLVAEDLAALPRLERDIFPGQVEFPEMVRQRAEPEVELQEVLVALAEALRRAEMFQHHAVQMETLSVRERMSDIRVRLSEADGFVSFASLLSTDEGRMGVIVSFLALLELIRDCVLEFVQSESYAPIYVRAAGE